MTNGERLLKSNLFEVLCMINEEMWPKSCLLRVFKDFNKEYCLPQELDKCYENNPCRRCIAEWLSRKE